MPGGDTARPPPPPRSAPMSQSTSPRRGCSQLPQAVIRNAPHRNRGSGSAQGSQNNDLCIQNTVGHPQAGHLAREFLLHCPLTTPPMALSTPLWAPPPRSVVLFPAIHHNSHHIMVTHGREATQQHPLRTDPPPPPNPPSPPEGGRGHPATRLLGPATSRGHPDAIGHVQLHLLDRGGMRLGAMPPPTTPSLDSTV